MSSIDAVYPLGDGSRWNDEELRYSLRSLEAKFDVRNVYVIGRRPKWYTGDYVEYKETGSRTENVFYKTKLACETSRVSDDFLFMNDDIFLLNDIKPAHYYCKTIKHKWRGVKTNSKYWEYIQTKLHWLNFATHTPFFINKEEWLSFMEDVKLVPGFSPRDYYGNKSVLWDRKSIQSDVKFRGTTVLELKDYIKGLPFFSTHSGMNENEFGGFFRELYPNKSRWEK